MLLALFIHGCFAKHSSVRRFKTKLVEQLLEYVISQANRRTALKDAVPAGHKCKARTLHGSQMLKPGSLPLPGPCSVVALYFLPTSFSHSTVTSKRSRYSSPRLRRCKCRCPRHRAPCERATVPALTSNPLCFSQSPCLSDNHEPQSLTDETSNPQRKLDTHQDGSRSPDAQLARWPRRVGVRDG